MRSDAQLPAVDAAMPAQDDLVAVIEVAMSAEQSRLQREQLTRFLATGKRAVVAVGGSLVSDSESWALLRRAAFTVWLKARAKDHWFRVIAQGDEDGRDGVHDSEMGGMLFDEP